MWLTIILMSVRWLIGSGIVNRILDIVAEVDEARPDLDGASKWRLVWSEIRTDSEVVRIMEEKGKWIINLAIEAAVGKIRT